MHVVAVKNRRKTVETILRKMAKDVKTAPKAETSRPFRTPALRQPVGATLYLPPSIKSIKGADKIVAVLYLYKRLMRVEAFKKAFKAAKNRVGLSIDKTKQGIAATISRFDMSDIRIRHKKGQAFENFAEQVGEALIEMGQRPEPEKMAASITKKA